MTAVEPPRVENRSVYQCAVCGASTPVAVMDLTDPRSLISEKDVQGLKETAVLKARFGRPADHDPRATMCAELLEEFTKEKLLYATCPRCAKRNPAAAEANATRPRTWSSIQPATVGV